MPRSVLLAAGLITGCAASDPTEKVKEIDAATFRAILQCANPAVADQPSCESLRDEARRIERVRIEPTDKGSARYVLTMNNVSYKTVVFAEYPGKITDELTAARIPYHVKPR